MYLKKNCLYLNLNLEILENNYKINKNNILIKTILSMFAWNG